jgi:hypothetical protein
MFEALGMPHMLILQTFFVPVSLSIYSLEFSSAFKLHFYVEKKSKSGLHILLTVLYIYINSTKKDINSK